MTAASAQLAEAIAAADFSGSAATVIGYGNMGRHYVRALRTLGVPRIRVCSRSQEPLNELQGVEGIATIGGGYPNLDATALPGELGIVATPTSDLVGAAMHMASRGFKRILVEKPVSLWSQEIQGLAQHLEQQQVYAACGYNRVAYPSFREAGALSELDGGITSCTYTFTEFVEKIGPGRFPDDELARWGIANSLHVMSLAHGLIGLPESWNSHRYGSLPWHSTGSVFVGSGISQRGIPFAFHADWGSTGRWSVEVHTRAFSYRLCPLEQLYRRASAMGDWEEVPISAFAPGLKAGITEEVAAMLSEDCGQLVPLVSIKEAAELVEYGETLFGYRPA